MSSNEAMLLPDLCRKFQETLSSESSSFPHLSITTNEFPSTRWFICRLNHYFGDSIVFECRHRYIGTVVFHKNCDLLTALSTALGQQRSAERRAHCSLDVQINNVTSHFHGKLHEQAKRFTCEYKSPEKYTTMDFSALIQNTDQELLKFISQLTESKKKRKLFDSQEEQPISSKAIRHFYALCVLLFNTNSACCAPLHVLLTEAIICHGGNTELVKILNRVGAVACMDTCNRLTTKVVTQRLREGIKRAVICGVISFASIDNIDILQPWSVSVRSWHGTSVQIMQPFPQTGTLWEDELASILTSTSSDLAHLNLSDSPIPVQRLKRRRRTLTEQPSPHTTMISPTNIPIPDVDGISYDFNERSPSISDFHLTEAETGAFKKLHEEIFLAMLLKYFNSGLEHTLNLPALPSLVHCLKKQAFEAECSNVAYVDILSEKSDSKATLLKVIGNLHKIFIKELNQKWVIVVGDAKIFVLLQELRIEYGENLRWLLPLPGDWHILFNFQKVLVKPYADAGIMSLAKVCGYGAETLKSLRNANKFRRTHLFFLQCFEAFYEFFLGMFFARDSIPPIEKERLKLVVHDLLHEFEEVNDVGSLEAFRANASLVIADKLPQSYDKFTAFMKNGSIQQDTMKFWHRFLFEDCFPYIALFTAIRYRNWNLRTGSLKQLAAIYRAFDRPTYQELIPRHLFDLAKLPESILSKLNDGGFAMRLSNTDWRGVALDECHEMNINKDAKLAVIRPSPEKMQFLSSSLPFWAKVINNMKEQLFPERQKHKTAQCYTATTRDKAVQANVRKMVAALQSHAQFFDPEENKGLWNFLDMVQATPDQAHDLLNFRAIGQEAFDNLVKCRMLKIASTSAPVRKKRLQTFTTTPTHTKRIKQVEKEGR
ncbi:hypothetical protein SPONN_2736 [uncultured Candidatus Thioglobus sp.]|nr:hypothetical protein SPONN_2736 [uncultured Candidatus Thioglobus sp.]